MLTQDYLKTQLKYDPETGVFTWATRKKGVTFGAVAGYTAHDGYKIIKLDQHLYQAHRLAWLYMFGNFPAMLDHRNQIRGDNRIKNLRPCTTKQNAENQKMSARNKSGFRGVIHNTRYPNNPFVAQITHCNKLIHIGNFKTAEEASVAYERKRNELFTHHRYFQSLQSNDL